MKHILYLFTMAVLSVAFVTYSFAQIPHTNPKKLLHEFESKLDLNEDPDARKDYELMRLRDPKTGKIPLDIRKKELQFSLSLPSQENNVDIRRGKKKGEEIQSVNWMQRGPSNIGGRTPALAFDVTDENIILAGSTSGGMWRSTDKGDSWIRTTPVNERPNISSLVQDRRPNKTSTWYYSTGEVSYASAGWPPYYGDFVGNGIFKSTDNGITWNILPSTVSDDSVNLIQPFSYVAKLAVDPSNDSEDIIYAAAQGGIMRSSDGGTSWTMTLGSFPEGSGVTDVVVTSKGVVYAAMSEYSVQFNTSPWSGMYRSVDGIHWTNITPAGWQSKIFEVYIDVAPSNENVLYVSSDAIDNASYPNYFWKYTYRSGDGSDTNGVWEDRSDNFNQSGIEYAGYVKVSPENENMIFMGRLNLWRSTDGLATADNVTNLSEYQGQYVLHVDHEVMSFSPSNPTSVVIGCDGGIYESDDVTADGVQWTPLDNNYVTAQFYTVAIDHSTSGNDIIIGGTQDNGTNFIASTDSNYPWSFLFGGDGSTCAISDNRSSYYVSYQYGQMFREIVDDFGETIDYTRIDPIGGSGYIWINPYALDPNNTDQMYLGAGHYLWRNNNLPSIPMGHFDSTSVGWTKLTQSATPSGQNSISAVAVSTKPANIVYYGTNNGRLFRLDSANIGNHKPTDIGSGKGFPTQAFINCIAIDPEDANKVIVVFANYSIKSIFSTTDGGATWTPISGNLEENPDGTGNGPSCRWVSILHVSNGTVYLVATSTGLYATSSLNGIATVWSLEGESAIGHSVVDMIDVRQSDGMVAVGTHGHGMFSTHITSVLSTGNEYDTKNAAFSLAQNFPNPFSKTTTFTYTIPEEGEVSLKIYDVLGNDVATIRSEHLVAGTYTSIWKPTDLPSGLYFYKLTSGKYSEIKQTLFEK